MESQQTPHSIWQVLNSQFVSSFLGAGFGAFAAYLLGVFSEKTKHKETLAFEWMRYKSNSQLQVVNDAVALFFTARALLEQWKLDIENRRFDLDLEEQTLRVAVGTGDRGAIQASTLRVSSLKQDLENWSNFRREQYNKDVYVLIGRSYALLFGYKWCIPPRIFAMLQEILTKLDSTQVTSDVEGIRERLGLYDSLQPKLLNALSLLREDVSDRFEPAKP